MTKMNQSLLRKVVLQSCQEVKHWFLSQKDRFVTVIVSCIKSVGLDRHSISSFAIIDLRCVSTKLN